MEGGLGVDGKKGNQKHCLGTRWIGRLDDEKEFWF
jgi:hypothetical protein